MKEYHPIGSREFSVLKPLLERLPERPNVVEVGTGASTKFFWEHIKIHGGTLTSIDIDQERLDHFVPDGAHKVLRVEPFEPKTNRIDLLFIDGKHLYLYVKNDINLFLPLMNTTGIVCGHDYESDEYDEAHIHEDFVGGKHHGCIKAVNEIFGKVKFGNSVWWKGLK